MTVKKRCREDSCTNTPHPNAQTGSCNVNTVKRSSPSASQRWDCLTFINLLANLTPRSVAFRPSHACITESSDLLPKIIQEVYSDWPVRKKRRWKHLSILGDAFPRLGTAFGSHDCENKQKTDRSIDVLDPAGVKVVLSLFCYHFGHRKALSVEALPKNFVTFTLDDVVMQMRKVKRKKGYWPWTKKSPFCDQL